MELGEPAALEAAGQRGVLRVSPTGMGSRSTQRAPQTVGTLSTRKKGFTRDKNEFDNIEWVKTLDSSMLPTRRVVARFSTDL